MNGSFASTVPQGRFRNRLRQLWRVGKRPLLIFGSLTIVFLLVVGVLAGVNFKKLENAYAEGLAGKSAIENAQQAVLEQNFASATFELQRAQEHFETVNAEVTSVIALDKLPWIGRQIKAVEQLSVVGAQLAHALETFTFLGEEIAGTLSVGGDVNLAALDPEQKRAVLEKLSQAPPQLIGAKADIALASNALDQIPETGLFGALADAIQPLKDQLPEVQRLYDESLPLIEVLPAIAGYPEQKTYLFLLQNNNEIRPTGGFIGTYGVLKLKDGEIISFETDNIYNLDEPNKGKEGIPTPPAAINKYIGSTEWFMRDTNWSPDFPTSAQEALDAYHREDGPEPHFDGVIAITPTFIESLMEITGPITVDGIEFRSDNLVDELQFQVEAAFREKGIAESDRKEIIGELASQIMDRVLGVEKEQIPQLWEIFLRNVNQKHILVYVKDEYAQELVEQQNWSGSMKHTEGDFFNVVDANLAALKTDKVMERNISYDVEMHEDGLHGKLRVSYKNNGTFTFFTTRYRTFTRIYLPPGTELLSANGYMTNDFFHGGEPTDPEVYEEMDKTVVAGFIPIEPQKEGVIELEYRLPEKITEKVRNDNEYFLLAQKQSGAKGYGLHVTFDVGEKIDWRTPYLDISDLDGDNKVVFDTDLLVDRDFYVRVK